MRISGQHAGPEWAERSEVFTHQALQRSLFLASNQLEDLRPSLERSLLARALRTRGGDAGHGLLEGLGAAAIGVGKNLVETGATLISVGRHLGARDWGGALRGLGMVAVKLLQTPVDAILMIGGRLLSALQTLTGLEPVGRPLSGPELERLRPIFGDAIAWERVSIKEGKAGLLTLPRRPFVHGNTIYVPPPFLPVSDATLVHELVHVWQHQHGGTDYMSEALWAQAFGDGYDIAKGLREGRRWSELNPEQQAELLEVAFRRGYFAQPQKGFHYAGADWTGYLTYVLSQVRAGKGAP